MKVSTFRAILKEKGYTTGQILALQHFGLESAKDAHAGMENMTNFQYYCLTVGRDFVIDNLDSLSIDDDGNVTWID